MQKNLIKYIVLAVVIIAGVLWYLLSGEMAPGNDAKVVYEIGAESDGYADMTAATTTIASGENLEATQSFIKVHVCGEVIVPGVYQLESGARVIQAIEAAGGATAEAMADYLNLASIVNDGERIYVPSEEEVLLGLVESSSHSGEAEEGSDKIDINTATKAELMQIPWIGENKAESIMMYREEHGDFRVIEDIMKIDGIKEAMFNRIKDYIKVQK